MYYQVIHNNTYGLFYVNNCDYYNETLQYYCQKSQRELSTRKLHKDGKYI